MPVIQETFQKAYNQLLYITYKKYPDSEPSFDSGFWFAQEGYKRTFWEEARSKMELDTWPQHRDDTAYILKRATQLFGILMSDSNRQQNLVSKPNYEKLLFNVFSGNDRIRKEAGAALYDIYFGDNDEAAFVRFSRLLRGINDPISVASLYFFLKDKTDSGDYQYVTARKEGTGHRLEKLGLNASCLQECKWENYQRYLRIVRELQEMLIPLHPSATLLDAQSFLWMLWMVERDTPEYEEQIDPFVTQVITAGFREGRRVEVYSTKYERDPRVRRSFLATHPKPYKCEACGMDFESIYGPLGKDVIEVHHKRPLSVGGIEQEIQPTRDYLACLCANCHRIIHRQRNTIMSVEELRDLIRETKERE